MLKESQTGLTQELGQKPLETDRQRNRGSRNQPDGDEELLAFFQNANEKTHQKRSSVLQKQQQLYTHQQSQLEAQQNTLR